MTFSCAIAGAYMLVMVPASGTFSSRPAEVEMRCFPSIGSCSDMAALANKGRYRQVVFECRRPTGVNQ